MKKHVTIQDIADALQLSRNTVSKALNSPESVPEATCRRVMEMATAMNYKSLHSIVESKQEKPLKIVLISLDNRLSSSFFTSLYQKLYEKAKQFNMELSIQLISNEDITLQRFPAYIHEADGILNMEVLNTDYIRALIKIGKPIVFFDFTADDVDDIGRYDIVLEQSDAIYSLSERVISQGKTRIGFFGSIQHCVGFHERFYSFRNAMLDHHLPIEPSICIIDDKQAQFNNVDHVVSRLRRICLPEAFICANDYMAFILMEALQKIKKRIPEDIVICGFDNVPDFWMHQPYLTTVECSKDMIAYNMLSLLEGRIRNPDLDTRILYVSGKPIIRQSLC